MKHVGCKDEPQCADSYSLLSWRERIETVTVRLTGNAGFVTPSLAGGRGLKHEERETDMIDEVLLPP